MCTFDTIGEKLGHDDKCCMIEGRRDGREPVVVTGQESTMEQAIHGAIRNLKKSVESALGKSSTRGSAPGSSLGISWAATLTGGGDWYYQKSAAEIDVHRLIGVVGITNEIKIKPQAQAKKVREKIEKALGRTALFNSTSISINADGDKVTLGGNVRDWRARRRDCGIVGPWRYAGAGQDRVW